MFALQPSQRQAPVTAANQQRLLMGFISRRAPIDSAFRAVFMPLGGLDARGRFKPGVRATEYLGPEGSRGAAFGGAIGLAYGSALGGPVGAVAGGAVGATVGAAILSPKILPASRLGPIGHYIERVRAGVNDRYGLPDDYVRASRQQSLDERAIAAEGLEHLEAMKNAGIGTAEARVLYSMLTGDVVGHKDLEGLSEPIIRTIDQHGLEMVELGLISRESYERNRGQYLHRTYLKHEQKQNRFTKLVEFVTVGMAKKILGNELKGRGIFEDIALSKLMRGNEDFNNGRRGAPDLGEKFHRIAEVVPQTDALALDRKDKVLRRIYLDADKPIPDRYKGPSFLNEGVWEVRRKRGTEFTIWRDYTKEERQRMGEISDARYAIAKTYLLMAHDLASGRFFKAVAENEEWSRSNVAEGEWRNPSDIDNGQEWVRVPDTIIQNTGGVPKYGAMAGRFVRSAIWRDLTELDRMHNPNSWRSLLTMWKLNKTARNPVVHMNNVVSNLVLADMADVTAVDLVDGIQSWLKKDQYYLDAQHHGAMGVDMISAEIRANHINPLLEEIVSAGPGNNGWMARSKIIGTMAKVWDGIVKLDGKMQDAYKAEDDIFRMAYYRKLIREGMDPFIAADMTREQFIDYDIRAPWVNSLRYSVMPFIGYTYRAVPLVANTMMERPWKLAKYATIAYMINALAYWADDEADEDQERASFRDEEQGYTWLGTQRLWRLPFRDDAERPMFIDTRRWIPAGDVFDIGQGSSAVPIPAPFMFGGPMMLAAELLLLNKSAFTGEEITGEYDTTLEKFSKSGGYALKSFIPSAPWIPGSWYWEKIKNAMTGAVDYSGNDYSVPLAVLNSVGIKARWQDVEQGLYWNGFEFNKEATELRRQARSLARKRQRNLISQSDFESAQAVLVLKMERVKERYGEFKEKADK
jgi:hypothetical protein